VRIFSTKAYRFDAPGETSVSVTARAFSSVPDWAEQTRLFQLGLKDGSITILTGAQSSAEVEKAMAESLASSSAPKRTRVTSTQESEEAS
jgi:hypothetical protein